MNAIRHIQSPLMRGQRVGIAPRFSMQFLLALIMGATFIFAGGVKAWDPIKFAEDISHFHVLSWPLGMRLAFYLPWLEIACGLALITGRMRLGGVGVLTALTLVFIGVTIAAKIRGINIDCGCFGSATKNLTFTWHLAIDFALLAGLAGLWFSLTHARARVA